MFLSRDEKIAVLLLRIEKERFATLMGAYKSYDIGENKIRKMQDKIAKLGGNTKMKLTLEEIE